MVHLVLIQNFPFALSETLLHLSIQNDIKDFSEFQCVRAGFSADNLTLMAIVPGLALNVEDKQGQDPERQLWLADGCSDATSFQYRQLLPIGLVP